MSCAKIFEAALKDPAVRETLKMESRLATPLAKIQGVPAYVVSTASTLSIPSKHQIHRFWRPQPRSNWPPKISRKRLWILVYDYGETYAQDQ